MMRAVWNGVVLAETPRTIRLEGNHYFPPDSVYSEYFGDSPSKTLCPWKGVARYHNIILGDDIGPDLAWRYPHPSPLALRIKNHVAFGGQVTIDGTREPAAERGPVRGLLARLGARRT
ncbi:DUF427 domain-containing protein [Haloechinothrix sp. YIM 98757]|uniref:DUF427 domain-containing protein n=1 Tax=Haloechinothrix aidingensis TaxID=2752311 RepID=A0A838A5W3_9PSEU|nr:DUF427 domain-containing protein [Haloechinothrix aidingensis]MBA0124438.1 DUF427 domain-containing protein [Haloechinothrix aidingensis]